MKLLKIYMLKFTTNAIFIHALAIAFSLLALLLILLPAGLSQPIADDYFYFYNDDTKSMATTVANHYTTLNGRWTQVLLVSIVYKLFGVHATQIVPVIEILLLTIASICLTFLILPNNTKKRALSAIAIGSVITITSLYLLPSIFDSIFWLTSSTVYICALISMMTIAACYLYLARKEHPSLFAIMFFSLFIIASQALNETASIITVLLFITIFISLISKRAVIGSSALKISAFGSVSASIGLLIVYFAPGTAARRLHTTSTVDLTTLLTAPLSNFAYLIDIILSRQVLLIIIAGLVISILMPNISKRVKINIAIIGALLTITPIYFNGLVAYYGVGGTPLRAYTIPIFLTVVGISLLVALGLQYITFKKHSWSPLVKPTILSFLVVCGVGVILSIALPLIQAQTLRKSLIEYRTASIQKQIRDNKDRISVMPAPNLLVSSEAVDLAYNANQTDWFVAYLQKYYKFEDRGFAIEHHQPLGYCLSDQAPSWFGVYICKDLANTHQN
jgi:hypothetical protein